MNEMFVKNYFGPGLCNIMRRMLRRTLVLVNGEWSIANKCFNNIFHHSLFSIHLPNDEVSDIPNRYNPGTRTKKSYEKRIMNRAPK